MYIALEQPTSAHLLTPDHDEVAVPVTLRYTSDEPLVVHLDFPAWISLDDEEVTWTFARTLLEAGLGDSTGIGTVRLRPDGPSHTVVELHGPQGTAALRFATPALHRFLARTYEIMEPTG